MYKRPRYLGTHCSTAPRQTAAVLQASRQSAPSTPPDLIAHLPIHRVDVCLLCSVQFGWFWFGWCVNGMLMRAWVHSRSICTVVAAATLSQGHYLTSMPWKPRQCLGQPRCLCLSRCHSLHHRDYASPRVTCRCREGQGSHCALSLQIPWSGPRPRFA